MKNNYVLVDYENVQPEDLSALADHEVNVLLFVGANQSKVPISLATSLQAMGSRAAYVVISGNGRNALDFHIAYEIGRIVERDADAFVHVISRDKGFDPLLQQLKKQKYFAVRSSTISEIPFLKLTSSASEEERHAAIVSSLIARGQSRPRKVKTLMNTINSLFQKTLSEPELTGLVEKLKESGCVVVEGESVAYRPPVTAS